MLLPSAEGERAVLNLDNQLLKCVQGINKSLQQITADASKFRSENDFC